MPAVVLVALEARAHFLISTWDLRAGAPEAPLAERIVVALYNWMVRLAPFFVAVVLLVSPLAIVFGGRRLAKTSDAQSLRADSLVSSALGMVMLMASGSVLLPILQVGLLAPAWALQWFGICFWVIAAGNTYALLAVSGWRWPAAVVFMMSLFSGPVGLFVFNAAFWAWGRRTRMQARAV